MNTKDIIKVVNANKAVLITTINELAEMEINFSKLDQINGEVQKSAFESKVWHDLHGDVITDFDDWYTMNVVEFNEYQIMVRKSLLENQEVLEIIPNIAELDYDYSILTILSSRISAMKDNLITYFNVQLDLPSNIKNVTLRNQLVNAITKVVKEME